MRILVSACLLGMACRYDGKAKSSESIVNLRARHELIPFCPEIYGGLPTPRAPAEIVCERVITHDGRDVTAMYEKGAQEALSLTRALDIDIAILKSDSPSCGVGRVHNGRFDGGFVAEDGVTAALLMANGITVISSDDLTDDGRMRAQGLCAQGD